MNVSGYRSLASVCILSFVIGIDVTIVNVALPRIQDAFAVSTGSLGWVAVAYSLTFATLMLSGGAWSDRFGHARVFMYGILVFGAGSLIDVVAPNFWLLVLGRAVQGFGAAMCTPAGLAVLRSSVPPQQLGRAMALWTFSQSVAVSAGPILSGALVQFLTWRSVFMINIVAVVPIIWLALPDVRNKTSEAPATRRKWDAYGQALYAVSSGLFVGSFIVLRHPSGGLEWSLLAALPAVSIAGLYAFFRHEQRFVDPVLPASLPTNKEFQSAVIIGGFIVFVNFGLVYCLGLYYGVDHGFTPLRAGIMFLPMMLACAVSTSLVERIRHAIGTRATIAAGIASNLVGSVFICVRPDSVGWVVANAVFLGFGVGLAIPPLGARLLGSVDVKISGVAGGMLSSTRNFAIALGVAILGIMVQGSTTSVHVELRAISAVCALIMLVALATYLATTRAESRTENPPKDAATEMAAVAVAAAEER
ncbi:MFS transporter [Frankia sp. R82]|uniref:MFS transporter n=1 Tax=Frankia sp. R82 TaxID=2950553 RepID=UPI0020439CB2|nr:MFS transporter [Frankia sp. R82]MCM3884564.1 MFS transporter [Frankia sp. R82]